MSEKTPTVTVPQETGSNQSPLEAMLEQKMQEKRMSAWTDTDNLESMKDMQSYLQERNSHDMRVDQYSNESDPLDKGVFENDVFYDKESEVVYAVEAAGEVNGAQIYTISESYKNGAEKKTVMNAKDAKAYLTGKELVDAGSGRELLEEVASHASAETMGANQDSSEQSSSSKPEKKTREEQDYEAAATASNNVLEEEQRKTEADAAVAQEASNNVAASEEEQPSLGELVETQTTSAESAPVGENTPEAQQEGDARTQATDEVADILANDSEDASVEQEASTETPRVRGRKKMAAWVMNKFAGIKHAYTIQKRAKRVQKLKTQQRRENLIATSEQIAAEKSEDENYAPLTKKDFNFRSRHGIGKRAKERDPIYEEAARRLNGVAENEEEIQTEPMTNIDGGAVESPADTQRTEVIDTARLPAAPTAGEVLRQQREENPFYNYDFAPEAKVRDGEVKFESKPGDQVQLTQYEAAEMEQLDEFTYKIPGYEGRWKILAGTDKLERLPDEANNESAA